MVRLKACSIVARPRGPPFSTRKRRTIGILTRSAFPFELLFSGHYSFCVTAGAPESRTIARLPIALLRDDRNVQPTQIKNFAAWPSFSCWCLLPWAPQNGYRARASVGRSTTSSAIRADRDVLFGLAAASSRRRSPHGSGDAAGGLASFYAGSSCTMFTLQ